MSSRDQLLLESTLTQLSDYKPHFLQTQTGPWEDYQNVQTLQNINTPLASREKNISPPKMGQNIPKIISTQVIQSDKKLTQSSRILKSDRIIENWLPSQIPQTFKLEPSFKRMQLNLLKQSLNIVGKKARSLGRNQLNSIEQYRTKISKTIRQKKGSISKNSVPSLNQSREKRQNQNLHSDNLKDRSCQTTFSQLPNMISSPEKLPIVKGLKKQKFTTDQFQQLMIQVSKKSSSKTIATQNDLILQIVSKLPSIFSHNDRVRKNGSHFLSF